jgi:hypothetical protein
MAVSPLLWQRTISGGLLDHHEAGPIAERLVSCAEVGILGHFARLRFRNHARNAVNCPS